MKNFLLVFVFVIFFKKSRCENLEIGPVVVVAQGDVRGFTERSVNGKEFFSFKKIPFARPPIGSLRFKNPAPAQKWAGVLNATGEVERCFQYTIFEITAPDKSKAVASGTEDCLYLNVHVPKSKASKKLPVMVWIHGGGFFFGDVEDYPPHVLMDADDFILVSFQYRLGIFGFLSTEDPRIEGNFGLKDQQLALKWIHSNIENFGGDPKQVTLFGESAGASSIHMHMFAPGSAGLFHRAILQSSTAFSPYSTVERHRSFAKLLGETFNCDFEAENYLECLQSVPAELILKQMTEEMKWSFSPLRALPRYNESFFADHPGKLLRSKKYHKVDIIMGGNRDEGGLLYSTMVRNVDMMKNLNRDFDYYGPVSLYLQYEEDAANAARKAYSRYLGRDNINEITTNDAEQLIKLYSDCYTGSGMDIALDYHSKNQDNVYVYQFDYRGSLSMTDLFIGPGGKWVVHMDELQYLFFGGTMLFRPLPTEQDLQMRKVFVELWTNFVKHGTPTTAESYFQWEKFRYEDQKYLSLTPKPKMKPYLLNHETEFWLSLETKLYRFFEKDYMQQNDELMPTANGARQPGSKLSNYIQAIFSIFKNLLSSKFCLT